MTDDDAHAADVHREIADMQEIERILFDLSTRYRNKDADTAVCRASNQWCFGLRALSSRRLPGECEAWEHKFEMEDFLCDALDVPHRTTFLTTHSERAVRSSGGENVPQVIGVIIDGFDKAAGDLHHIRQSIEAANLIALMHAAWE